MAIYTIKYPDAPATDAQARCIARLMNVPQEKLGAYVLLVTKNRTRKEASDRIAELSMQRSIKAIAEHIPDLIREQKKLTSWS